METVVSKDGTRIAYDALGQGPPLVIVNGALGVRTFTFVRKMAEELAKSFRVYNYDRRGRGDSNDTPPYSVQKEVEDLAAVCKAAGGKPYVFGMSSGAALALEAAAAGVPMAGLLAYEPPFIRANPRETADTANYARTVQGFIGRGQRDEAVAYFMRFVGVPSFAVPVMRLLPMWKVMRGAAHTLPYDAAILGSFEVPSARLEKIKVPTWVVAGAKTTPSLKLATEAAAKAVPGAQHRILPKSSHGVKPAAIAPLLRECFGLSRPVEAAA